MENKRDWKARRLMYDGGLGIYWTKIEADNKLICVCEHKKYEELEVISKLISAAPKTKAKLQKAEAQRDKLLKACKAASKHLNTTNGIGLDDIDMILKKAIKNNSNG